MMFRSIPKNWHAYSKISYVGIGPNCICSNRSLRRMSRISCQVRRNEKQHLTDLETFFENSIRYMGGPMKARLREDMKVRDIIKLLEEDGWYLIRSRGRQSEKPACSSPPPVDGP